MDSLNLITFSVLFEQQLRSLRDVFAVDVHDDFRVVSRKAVRRPEVKLETNTPNISQAAFEPIFFRQKVTKSNYKRRKASQSTFQHKF